MERKNYYNRIIIRDIRPLPDHILAVDFRAGEKRTKGGVLLMDDTLFRDYNIKPRWCRVYKVGDRVSFKDEIEGKWVLVEHGRWTYGVLIEDKNGNRFRIYKIDPKAILLVSDEKPF